MVNGRKACTSGTPCQPTELAQAVNCLVQHGRYSVEQLCGLLEQRFDIHVSRGQLYDWSNPYASAKDVAMPIRVLYAVQVLQQSPVVLAFLGLGIAHRVEPLASIAGSVARVRDEAFDVVASVGRTAERIREITDDERAGARPLLRDVKQQIAELESALESKEA